MTGMILPSTIQLLRFKFSLFLAPVFFFALSETDHPDPFRSACIFIILHLLIYPASNGYNSYMDRDESPIGGILNPMQPTPQLYHAVNLMDMSATLLGLLIGPWFAAGLAIYILLSRAYSFRGIRLKKYPLMAYLTVILCQGALTFALVFYGCPADMPSKTPYLSMTIAAMLVGGAYPLTQIYQHNADEKDGVRTISMMLGTKGTFIFCGSLYTIASCLLGWHYIRDDRALHMAVFMTLMLPVAVVFTRWAFAVWRDPQAANFRHTMHMNTIAALSTGIAFIILTFIRQIE